MPPPSPSPSAPAWAWRLALAAAVVLAALVDTSCQFDFSKTNFEAAFQGRCGRESPCEQLCFELHDGMFECECREGYVLHLNGYGCLDREQQKIWHRLPVTPPTQYSSDPDEYDDAEDADEDPARNEVADSAPPLPDRDVLYQAGAVISASLQDSTDAKAVVDVVLSDGRRPDVASYVIVPGAAASPTSAPSVPSSSAATTPAAATPEPPRVRFVAAEAGEEAADAEDPTPDTDCPLDCGPGGACVTETLDGDDGDGAAHRTQRCQCPLGRGGPSCQEEVSLRYPRFTGRGWLAFPALRAAYKRVSLRLEFRPEAWDGVLLLAGERDDLTGDYLAIVLNKGFVEFRFDCGSGQGVVRSAETVLLNQWNRLSVHRHRWDASIRLNSGRRVAGRSKGLFSRITFREPLFLGGPGNTTGLSGKLPVRAAAARGAGLRGCVRHLEVNDQLYDFSEDAMQGFDVDECSADRCSKVPCMHGGKCVTTGELSLGVGNVSAEGSAVCLCPLGYSGELCETRVDLLVPSFNGSSYLRYPGLGDSALSWLDLQLTLKPTAASGLILYNGHRSDGIGDFMALSMADRHVEFSFDLGTGPATVRSSRPLALGEWHEVRVSRTGRLAVLQVDSRPPDEVVAPGAFLQLSLPLSLYLGGVPAFHAVSPKVRARGSFVGCIQKVLVNERPLHLLASALAGVNVDNCPHPCAARPCGPLGRCLPRHDYFTCLCPGEAEAGAEPAAQSASGPAAPRTECATPGPPTEAPAAASPGTTALALAVDESASSGIVIGAEGAEHTAGERRLSAGFAGNGFMHFTDLDTVRRSVGDHLRVSLRLRTTASQGLVLWTGRRPEDDDEEVQAVHQRHGVHPSFGNDFLAVAVHDGYVHLRLDLGSGELFIGYNLTRVDNGQWHRVNVIRRGQEATLSVDNGPALGRTAPGRLQQLNANTGLYLGGVPDPARTTRGRYALGLTGCVADLALGEDLDFRVRLDAPSGESTNVAACG